MSSAPSIKSIMPFFKSITLKERKGKVSGCQQHTELNFALSGNNTRFICKAQRGHKAEGWVHKGSCEALHTIPLSPRRHHKDCWLRKSQGQPRLDKIIQERGRQGCQTKGSTPCIMRHSASCKELQPAAEGKPWTKDELSLNNSPWGGAESPCLEEQHIESVSLLTTAKCQ